MELGLAGFFRLLKDFWHNVLRLEIMQKHYVYRTIQHKWVGNYLKISCFSARITSHLELCTS